MWRGMCTTTGTILRSQRGFTFAEVMLALGLLVVLTIIFATSVPLAHRTAKLNGQYSQAISLCQHKIDQLRVVGYGRINYTELSDAAIIDDAPDSPPFSFTEVDDVEQYLPDPITRLTLQQSSGEIIAIATINWQSGSISTKRSTVSLSAIITNVE
ncbi:MAG: type IV pilus modification PilV family protein [Armatimonadota bacterium]